MDSSSQLTREEELAALIADQEADAQSLGRYDARTRFRRNGSSAFVELDRSIGESGDATIGDLVGRQDEQLHEFLGGDDTQIRRIPRPQRWSRRQIVSHIRKWVKEHGEVPGYADWNKPNGRGIPSSASIARHFGSFSAGIRAAGFEPRPVGGTKQTDPNAKRRKRIRKQKRISRLTSEQLAAAYVLYDRQGMSSSELGERLWREFRYPSPKCCAQAILFGFHSEGFRVRSKSEARQNLPPEKRQEIARRMHAAKKNRTNLTTQDVAMICAARGGVRQADLAARFGVAQTTISRVQRGLIDGVVKVAA